ncbi:hypothetical protein P389DRAFT_197886 [Cystobasidium minutum MCA 4210]|uniref:uncharacterized protein n=1 Tax=Cystobasidium minutum MCA 4210 TaxID=1397322 RepID=UPI0034CDD424|eukprot:jgi/Rhomi1/197886/gm1.6100_g
MARGLQKAQAQAKSKAKEAEKKGGNSTLKADKGLKYKCPKCLQDIDSLSNIKLHFTSKHPKDPEPDYDTCKKA